MVKSLLSLKELIYPAVCISCERYGKAICSICEAGWLVKCKKTKVLGIDHYFVTDYNNFSSKIILAAKEDGNKLAIKLLSISIANSIKFAVQDRKLNKEIDLVTIPSQKSAIKSRGRDHISVLAIEVVRQLLLMEINANHLPLLEVAKRSMDQSNLNSKERKENMKYAFKVSNSLNSQTGIFLIDDLITTGASIQEGVRALNDAKITINAIITACAVGRNFLIR